ncbi:MAG: site-2 protease family protein [Myxococcales bacterium]|nr:site-2 protease family protein [Myxococcales bacterium]
MNFSWRIASVRGIAIRVHVTFLLVVALGGFEWGVSHGALGALFGAVLVCLLFACVALHELGHSLVAQRLGVSVREILLLPIGGVARLGREPKSALDELLIAVAGPLVNVVIACLLVGASLLHAGSAWFAGGGFVRSLVAPPSAATLVAVLISANVALAVFNMIPALPMDGGRVFRALLTFVFGKLKATNIAATVGQVIAAGLAIFGLLSANLILVFIGVFVFMGAAQERSTARALSALAGLSAGDAVDTRALCLEPGDMLGVAMQHALRSGQPFYPVVLGERLVGNISREEILRAVRRSGPLTFVAGVMSRDLEEVDLTEPLTEVRSRLIERGGRPLVVRGPHGPLGLISLDDLARAASMADLLHHLRGPGGAEAR